jgi:uncharacterized protein (DUF1330 family)
VAISNKTQFEDNPQKGDEETEESAPYYSILDYKVKDPKTLRGNIALLLKNTEKHGGQVLVGGGNIKVIGGKWKPDALLIQKWPNEEAFNLWRKEAMEELNHGGIQILDLLLVEGLSLSERASRRIPSIDSE